MIPLEAPLRTQKRLPVAHKAAGSLFVFVFSLPFSSRLCKLSFAFLSFFDLCKLSFTFLSFFRSLQTYVCFFILDRIRRSFLSLAIAHRVDQSHENGKRQPRRAKDDIKNARRFLSQKPKQSAKGGGVQQGIKKVQKIPKRMRRMLILSRIFSDGHVLSACHTLSSLKRQNAV